MPACQTEQKMLEPIQGYQGHSQPWRSLLSILSPFRSLSLITIWNSVDACLQKKLSETLITLRLVENREGDHEFAEGVRLAQAALNIRDTHLSLISRLNFSSLLCRWFFRFEHCLLGISLLCFNSSSCFLRGRSLVSEVILLNYEKTIDYVQSLIFTVMLISYNIEDSEWDLVSTQAESLPNFYHRRCC